MSDRSEPSAIEALIEASSLGTPEAKALREQTPPAVARAIVLASKYYGQAKDAEERLTRAHHLVDDWQSNSGSRPLGDPSADVWNEAARQLLDVLGEEPAQGLAYREGEASANAEWATILGDVLPEFINQWVPAEVAEYIAGLRHHWQNARDALAGARHELSERDAEVEGLTGVLAAKAQQIADAERALADERETSRSLRAKVARVEAALDIRTRARAWMAHLGYEDHQIDKAEAWRQPREPWLQDDPPVAVVELEMAAGFAREYEETLRAALAGDA